MKDKILLSVCVCVCVWGRWYVSWLYAVRYVYW